MRRPTTLAGAKPLSQNPSFRDWDSLPEKFPQNRVLERYKRLRADFVTVANENKMLKDENQEIRKLLDDVVEAVRDHFVNSPEKPDKKLLKLLDTAKKKNADSSKSE